MKISFETKKDDDGNNKSVDDEVVTAVLKSSISGDLDSQVLFDGAPEPL